jgi:SAM-dependent methyltransferase
VWETVQSYQRSAASYVAATSSYDEFPEVLDALDLFERTVPAGLSVLDAGCGAGRDSDFLAGRGRKVIAADLSERLLHSWPERVVREASILRIQADLANMPICRRSLGGVWACASLIHQPPDIFEEVVAELASLLVHDGIFSASLRTAHGTGWRTWGPVTGRRWHTAQDSEDICRILASLGLTDIRSSPSGPGGWYIVRAKAE